ncbi:MAG: tetratricopeptide repeat protein [Planctomycetota bacterium]|jgi:TPR repeat protein
MSRIFLSIAIAVWAAACADAPADLNQELRVAQELLAAEKYDEAYAKFERVEAESGNPLAQFTLGLFWKLGWGRDPDPAKAADWFEKAAAGKIPVAEHYYAEILAEGVLRETDPATAARLYQRAADHGHHGSLCSLATMYETGTGVPVDQEKAVALLRTAAGHGLVDAQRRLGHRYLAAKDYPQAYGWFQQAADRNDPESQFQLGIIVRDGLGDKANPHAAIDWFERAAAQGHTPAYLPTGALFLDHDHERPEPDELAKAYLWLSAAARLTDDPESAARAKELLKKVLKLMPAEWRPDLDKKVDEHFKKHAG